VRADLLLKNGRIYTVDQANPVTEAMAVWEGRVVAAGSDEALAHLAGQGTVSVDLGGRAVIPGLIDSHLHLLGFGQSLRSVDLRGIESVDRALEAVAAAAERARPGEWIQGDGWDRHLFGRLPTREELDRVSPGNPVALASRDLHSLWVNSVALERAGIGPDTADPPDGEIVRDERTGRPAGVLREGARSPVFRAVPPPSPEDCQEATLRALRAAAASGLTGVQSFESVETIRAVQQLREEGRLNLRICCHLWRGGLDQAEALGLRTGFGDEWVRLGHLKLFLDGALGSRTALMLDPYTGTGDRGIGTMEREEFKETVTRAARAGIAVAVHAIGDAANRLAIEVLEETAGLWAPAGLRQRIEHVQLLAPGDAERLGALGIIASMQPSHATSDWQVADRHWAGRTGLAYAWRSVLDAGAPLAFGSDCPVEAIDPLAGLFAAITRQTPEGEPAGGWHPEQRLRPLEALRAFTLGAAYSSGEERLKGSLEVGKLADFVVLSADPLADPPEGLLTAKVEATFVGGRRVYGEL
jgi:predicted amidohydrolase YtcJ